MQDQFDPYLQWLGIRDSERPPNYYRLLGLELFEHDVDVIATAADRQMAHVRTFQSGQHSRWSQRILNEISQARVCLLQADQKARYDETLKKKRAASAGGQKTVSSPAPSAGKMPAAAPPRTAKKPAAVPVISASPGRASAARSTRRGLPVGWIFVGCGLLAVVGLVFLAQSQQKPATPAAALSDASSSTENAPMFPLVEPPPRDDRLAGPPSAVASASATPAARVEPVDPAAANSPPPWDAPREIAAAPARPAPPIQLSNEVADALLGVRDAMAARDIAQARTQLHVATQRAATPQERDEVERISEVLYRLEKFWEAVSQALREIRPGDRVEFRGQPVTVASLLDGEATLHAASGGEKTFPTQPAAMDPDLAEGLVRRQMNRSGPVMLAVVGTFLAMDREADLTRARQLWEEAARQAVPVEPLLAETEFDYRAIESASLPVPIASATPATPEESPPASVAPPKTQPPRLRQAKRDPPDAAALAESQRLIRDLFKEDYAARDPQVRLALARKLLQQGIDTTDDPVSRFTLFQEARELALGLTQLDVALSAIDHLARSYEVDPLPLRLEVLTAVGRRPASPAAVQELTEATLTLVDEAVAADDYAAALQLAEAALSTAQRMRDVPRIKFLQERIKDLSFVQKEYAQVAPAVKQLTDDPQDPTANLALGNFLCLAKGDFDRGLKHLALGGAEELADLARSELASPADSAAQITLADAWWALS